MININDIHFSYQAETEYSFQLTNCKLQVNQGDHIVLLGANGSGKSTLLKLICGMLEANKGTIIINNKLLKQYSDLEKSKLISIINQNPESGTASDLTLAENMRLAYLRGSTKSIRIRLDAKFKEKAKKHLEILKMGLENKIELKAKELSGGQRQALTLAMATFNEFSILVLDEPTAALDPKSANQVNQYIKHIMKNKGICSVMVTHNLNDAVLMGNRIIYMDRGVIIKDLSGLAKESLSSNDLFSWFKS